MAKLKPDVVKNIYTVATPKGLIQVKECRMLVNDEPHATFQLSKFNAEGTLTNTYCKKGLKKLQKLITQLLEE